MHVTDEMVEAAYDGWRKAPIGAPMEDVESRRRRCIRAALEAALRAAPAAEPVTQCCMCGKTGLSTVEGDGGSECQLSDGRWACSFECWERATERDAPPAPVADGITAEIAAERRRQIEVEGWTPEHDDEHRNGEMARVAATYAYVATLPEVVREYVSGCYSVETHSVMRELWPRSWSRKWWKPKDRRRDLVRACALLMAEIERLDRLPAAPTEAGR